MIKNTTKLALVFTLAASMVGCANYMHNQQAPISEPEDVLNSSDKAAINAQLHSDLITKYKWHLQREVNATGVSTNLITALSNNKIHLVFDDEKRLSVLGLCNILNAQYKVEGASISIIQPITTMRMCPDEGLMNSEQSIAQTLPLASSWSISSDTAGATPSLSIQFNNGNLWFLNATQ